ncbi:thioredoxin family protein [Pseudoxanthomonas daejeonensis]|nr:thioredoxin family protein [Pseudoxanthomonas daejeonensis]UNK56385.1 thioredoxin family protein [Pseudoxanthomonas daejeonensis]
MADRGRPPVMVLPLFLVAMLLSACGGQEAPPPSGPPLPVDTTPQKPVVADTSERVASGNTPAAADIAAIAALGASFDPNRSAANDLETAKVEAKRGSKRIVLELGDAACGECAALDQRIEGEAPLRHLRDAGFVWVKIDRSAPQNAPFLAAYPGSTEAPAPHLLVLDADAQVLHAQSGHELLRKGKPDRRRIREFLEQWAPPPAAP